MTRRFRTGTAHGARRATHVLLLAALAGAAACGAGPLPPAPVAAQDLLYVASQDAVTVAVIDMASRTLVETVDLKELGFSPTAKAHHVAVEPDGSFWYVSLIADGKVLKFDRENRLVGQIDFETPGMLSLDPVSNWLYVGRSMAAVNPPQRVGLIDRSTMTVEEIDVFITRPHALTVDARHRRFFTASLGQNSVAWAPVAAEDVELMQVDGHMNHMLVQFAVSPDGSRMVAGGQMTGEVLVFDLTTDEPAVVATLDVGGQPWHPTWTPDGRFVWIPNQAANTVSVIDAGTWTVTDVISHPALAEPHGTAVSRDGSTIWVSSHNTSGTYRPADGSDRRPGTVVAIDAASHEVVAVIEVGEYGAGMATAAVAPGQ